MKVRYTTPPRQGEPFRVSVDQPSGLVRFEVFINGALFADHLCDDPPCYETFQIPDRVSGSTLLLKVADRDAAQEFFFFINDDGKGIPLAAPTNSTVSPAVTYYTA